jgi:CelD/BcsL family acetyltransferase involved in cellulose biosynthesis
MHPFLLPIDELTQPELERWRELAGRALEPNPFFEPQFVLPAAARLDPGEVALLGVAASGGEWLACLPVQLATRWKRLPVTALVGWRHLYCFLGTPLVAPDEPAAALARLLDRALDNRPRPRMVALEWLRADGPVAEALGAALDERPNAAVRLASFERAALVRRPDAGYLDGMLRPHRRRELHRLRRRLAEEMGAPLELLDRSDDPAAVDTFVALEASGWKGRGGTAFASRPQHADLFRELCRGFREAGRLQLLALTAGDRPVALKCNLLAGDEVFCFKIAYDESLARFSPGVQLEQRMVDVFHEDMTQARMDSCADPGNDMINRLWPDRRPLESWAIPAGGAAGWASMRGIEAALQIHNRARRAS